MPHLPYFKFVQYIMMSARDLLPPFTQRPFTGNTDKPFVSAEYPLINFNICLKMIMLIFSLNIEIFKKETCHIFKTSACSTFTFLSQSPFEFLHIGCQNRIGFMLRHVSNTLT